MNAARRPYRRVMAPTGKMQAAMPTTKIEMGSVASTGSGASLSPMMALVAHLVHAARQCATRHCHLNRPCRQIR